MSNDQKILVTGASGYIGSRLITQLVDHGYSIRAAGRSKAKIAKRPWAFHPLVEIVEMDIFDENSLRQSLEGCSAAFYLIHSLPADQKDFASADRLAAENMTRIASETGLKRIIYLGGLWERQDRLSKHLQSRHEVAEILNSGQVPVTTLRAAMIIGAGSASFEILRHMVNRLSMMVVPRWVTTESQPIAIRNVIDYLVGCLQVPKTIGQSYDIGGPDILTYRTLMEMYAQEAGLNKRYIIPVPVLLPQLSACWVNLITPIPIHLTLPLAEGLRNKLICRDNRIQELVPQRLLDCREAIRLAIDNQQFLALEETAQNQSWIPPVEWKYPGDPVGVVSQPIQQQTVSESR